MLPNYTMLRQRVRSGEEDEFPQEESSNSSNIIFPATKAKYNLSAIIGMADTKSKLLAAINDIRRSKGSRNGILLSGPPGNGKTTMAEAIAGELNLPIISVSIGDLASRWINQTTEQISKLFSSAYEQAPCVLFLDEIDSVLVDRANIGNADSETSRITNTLLTKLVEARRRGVVVIGATNYIDKLDAAARREGRFDFKLEIPAPDYEARKGLLQSFLKSKNNRVTISEEALDRAARKWEGFSVARLQALAETLSQSQHNVLTWDDLYAALRKVQGHAATLPDNVMPLSSLLLTPDMHRALHGLAKRLVAPEKIEALGGNLPAGVLFTGPPGTGKTKAVGALAKESGWTLINVTGKELLHKPEHFKELLARAKDLRPSIFFIDEADEVLGHRQYSNTVSLTNEILAALDGIGGQLPDILFIAATNQPDLIDPAVLRGGRFTEKIEFENLNDENASATVKKWKKNLKIHCAVPEETIVETITGRSHADANAFLNTLVNLGIERNIDHSITSSEFQLAIKRNGWSVD